MAQTTITTQIDKATTYPEYTSITASNNMGYIMACIDDSYTEQMFYELPSVTIEIYVTGANSEKVLYKSRAIELQISNGRVSICELITDIPSSCFIALIPNFDNSAFKAHNEAVLTAREIFVPTFDESWKADLWDAPITEFPITIIWDDGV